METESTAPEDLGPGLGLDDPEQPQKPGDAQDDYRVLARKYRPRTFGELIGQDAMVQTLANAIRTDRIAHGILMTGVRGVGKTSTARLIAKALNCIGPDGNGGPTIDPCGVCEPCRAIAEGRHIDVIELDAASNRGIDDVREMTEAVRYSAVSARYKIYIIDEVHMMTKEAFNALLKTLEEPPPHVKFLFATTEVDKVPVTVLSRCQRFDLKRIPTETLADHFGTIAQKEGIKIDGEALAIIARAAEGSVRDGLSLLDQAIAHGGETVEAGAVRDMLGLADRARVRTLFDLLLEGDAQKLLEGADEAYRLGVEPASLMRGLMDACHAVSRRKASGADDVMRADEERAAIAKDAETLGWPQLHALYQLLLRGLQDVEIAPDPREALDMALLRVLHAAGMPDPGAVIDALANGKTTAAPVKKEAAAPSGEAAVAAGAPEPAPKEAPAAAPTESETTLPADFRAFVALIDGERPRLGIDLHDHVGLVDYAPPRVVLAPCGPLDSDFARLVAMEADKATGEKWQVELREADAAPSLAEQERRTEQAKQDAIRQDPTVKAVMDVFPDATIHETKEAG